MILNYFDFDAPNSPRDLFADFPEDSEAGRTAAVLRKLGVKAGVFTIGDPALNEEYPAVTYLHYPAGVVVARHAHSCARMDLVLRGSYTTERGEVMTVGTVMLNEANEYYGPHTIGPEGCVTMEVFASFRGMTTDVDDDVPISEAYRRENAHILGDG